MYLRDVSSAFQEAYSFYSLTLKPVFLRKCQFTTLTSRNPVCWSKVLRKISGAPAEVCNAEFDLPSPFLIIDCRFSDLMSTCK